MKRIAVVYALLVGITMLSYSYATSLLTVQTPWINVAIGKASANTVLALVLWTVAVERIGKKRNWSSRRIWALLACGVTILMMVVYYTPLT